VKPVFLLADDWHGAVFCVSEAVHFPLWPVRLYINLPASCGMCGDAGKVNFKVILTLAKLQTL
jgi:hypothetical protein